MAAKGKKAKPPPTQSLNLPKMPNRMKANIRVRRMGNLGREAATGYLKRLIRPNNPLLLLKVAS